MGLGHKLACIIIGMILGFIIICVLKVTKLKIDECVQSTGKILECSQLYR